MKTIDTNTNLELTSLINSFNFHYLFIFKILILAGTDVGRWVLGSLGKITHPGMMRIVKRR